MPLEFEHDMNCSYLDKQYMMGDKLLAAPIFNDEGTALYYLPEGTWTNYLTGETAEGGHWRKEHHDYCSIPLWVRENSIVPVQKNPQRAVAPYAENLELKVYALKDQAETTVYQDNKEILHAVFNWEECDQAETSQMRGIQTDAGQMNVSQTRENQAKMNQAETIHVNLTGTQGCSIRFVNCILKSVEGGSMELDGQDTIVKVSDMKENGVKLICTSMSQTCSRM